MSNESRGDSLYIQKIEKKLGRKLTDDERESAKISEPIFVLRSNGTYKMYFQPAFERIVDVMVVKKIAQSTGKRFSHKDLDRAREGVPLLENKDGSHSDFIFPTYRLPEDLVSKGIDIRTLQLDELKKLKHYNFGLIEILKELKYYNGGEKITDSGRKNESE